ncbi:hypothetical protein [Streptomyces nigra]|uniref:hypothetical protein n=1 Tax=Streptomyces nigra TaxID=1827580 RepID=UPI0013DDD47A|nr:hypothetical protein [Streptomyces nigra]
MPTLSTDGARFHHGQYKWWPAGQNHGAFEWKGQLQTLSLVGRRVDPELIRRD